MRDHQAIPIEDFNGLWSRDPIESCPIDHFTDCENVQSGERSVKTRDGIDTFLAKGNILRMYNYKMLTGESLILLDTVGDFYHALLDGSETVYGPILSIPTATDFGFEAKAGRAYITPFTTFVDGNGRNYQKGIENEFVYVYKGDGTAARKAAGNAPTNSEDTPFIAYNGSQEGAVDLGIHALAVTFSDGADDSTGLGTTILPVIYAPGGKNIVVGNLPIGGVGITERRIWMTKVIDPKDWTGADPAATFTFYLAKVVGDNTTLNTVISISDADLVTAFSAGSLANPTSGGITAVNTTTDGYCDLGLHVIGVVYETDTGYLTAPGPEVLAVQTFIDANKAIKIDTIPTSPDSFVTKRHLVASKAISLYNGEDRGFQLFFIPGGNIDDNTTTTKTLSFFDAELLDDASHLIDNFAEIPAGVTLETYHNRMVLTTTFDDQGITYLSAVGEPEAFNQVDGLIIPPQDGLALTNAQEFRDILYLFKQTRTYAYSDNNDEPSTWPLTVIDQGIGASVHGVGTVLDSGGTDIDYLLIFDWSGIMTFNGAYSRPELSWKIENFWLGLDRNAFSNIQVMNDTINKRIYITLPNKRMLAGYYNRGFDPQNIRWWPWRFDIETTTIALIETDVLVIGAEQAA